MSDVFISYSRRDIDFVRHLFDQLTARDREAWADWQDIPPTADWLAGAGIGNPSTNVNSIRGELFWPYTIGQELIVSNWPQRGQEATQYGYRLATRTAFSRCSTERPRILANCCCSA